MKLCTIISEIDKSINLELTALALREKGIEQHFILINCQGGALVSFLRNEGFPFDELVVSKISKSFPQVRACKRLLKNIQPDIVHCHLASANWVGLWASKRAGIKSRIYTRHSGKPLQLSKKEWIIDKIQNKLATHIIAISKNISEVLSEQGVSENKTSIIHHGFDLNSFENVSSSDVMQLNSRYNPASKHPVIGVNARWMKWKGIQYTISAFQEILQQHPNALLCLFGASDNADYSAEISSQLAKLPSESIQRIPFEKNVFALYHIMDVYVHVPVNKACEAFGQTYVEALAAGIPSVFTMSGIAREFIVDQEHALVVPFNNSDAITQAINALISNSELKASLIKNGKLIVKKHFTFESYVNNLVSLYQHN